MKIHRNREGENLKYKFDKLNKLGTYYLLLHSLHQDSNAEKGTKLGTESHYFKKTLLF